MNGKRRRGYPYKTIEIRVRARMDCRVAMLLAMTEIMSVILSNAKNPVTASCGKKDDIKTDAAVVKSLFSLYQKGVSFLVCGKNKVISIVVRTGSPTDIPALIAVFQSAVRVTNRQDYTPKQVEAWAGRGNEIRFRELFGEGLCFFVAEIDSVCAGFASVSKDGLLHSLFVAPECQRQGVASALVRAVVDCAAENGIRTLVSDVSITALPFFLKEGFSILKEQEARIGSIVFRNYRMSRNL